MKMTAPGGQGFDYDSDSEEPAVGMAAMIAPTFEAMTAGEFDVHDDAARRSQRREASRRAADGDQERSRRRKRRESAVEQFKSMVSQVAFVLPENPPDDRAKTWTHEGRRQQSRRRQSDRRNDLHLRRHARSRRHDVRRDQARR